MRLIPWILFVHLLSLCVAETAQACGDKFLVVGRGVRPKQHGTKVVPASILLYQNPTSESAAVGNDPELQASLMKAGHAVALAEDTRTLHEALASGKYDIIVAALTDALNLKKEAAAVPSKPVVLPVVYNPTVKALDDAKVAFDYVLSRPGKTTQLLAVIDQAMRRKK
jgi:hypothetical protein